MRREHLPLPRAPRRRWWALTALALGVVAWSCGRQIIGSVSAPVALRPIARASAEGPGRAARLGPTALAWPLVPGQPARVALVNTAATEAAATLVVTAPAVATPGPAVAAAPSVGTAARAFERRPTPLALGGVPVRRLTQAGASALGDQRTFWVVRSGGEPVPDDVAVSARAVWVGPRVEVFVDDRVPPSAHARAAALGAQCEAGILPTNVRLFGEPVPPAGASARITLVISPTVNDDAQDPMIGYFATRDLVAPTAGPRYAHSNQGLLIYLAADPVVAGETTTAGGTVAHELAHLIVTTRKLFGPRPAHVSEAIWLEEALAMYAMRANGFGLASEDAVIAAHVRSYLAAPQAYSLTAWERNPGGSGYGVAYLFMAYVVDRFGEGVLRELVDEPLVDVANLDARLARRGSSLTTAFADWAIANMAAQAAPLAAPGARRQALLPWSARFVALTTRTARPAAAITLDAGAGLAGWVWTP